MLIAIWLWPRLMAAITEVTATTPIMLINLQAMGA